MALRFAAGRQQYFPFGQRDRGFAADPRLHPGRAESLRHVLLRQDHDHHLLDPPDVLPGRSAHRLSLFPLFAHAPACAQRRIRADPHSRPRRRRRSAAARDRKRRGEENLAGRNPVAVHVRSGPVDPRHSGARHFRRSRARGDRARQCRTPRRARRAHAFGLRDRRQAGNITDAGAPARPRHQPPAVARRGRRGAAARARQCRGSVAAPDREDRLRPDRGFRERQVDHRHRRRRLDRRGNLRPHRHLRRIAPAGGRECRSRPCTRSSKRWRRNSCR